VVCSTEVLRTGSVKALSRYLAGVCLPKGLAGLFSHQAHSKTDMGRISSVAKRGGDA